MRLRASTVRRRATEAIGLGALALALTSWGHPATAQLADLERAQVAVATDRTGYAPGESVRLLVELRIDDGWHVNANPASFDFLIPTSAAVELPEGWPEAAVEYPRGKLDTFAFSDEPLSVYEGHVTLVIRTAVPAGTAEGEIELPVRVTYQACDDRRCLPPISGDYAVTLRVGPGGEPTVAALTLAGAPQAGTPPTPGGGTAGANLALILVLGLVGGLILNGMPCVLPVLSLKLLGLVKAAGQSRRQVTAGALITTLGILASFWALALAAIVASQLGGAVGWGIQFQNPVFVTVLAVIVTFFCLNLWGLFEIGLPGWLARSGDVGTGTGFAGHFGSGLFTTVMATPCSAPFLGTAVAFALGQPAGTIVAVATAIGLGMALPYLALAVAPRMVYWLPKPGAWMAQLRVVLGFLLAATVVWLLYVLAGQVPSHVVAYVQLALLALALALWVRHRVTGRVARRLGVAGVAAAVVATLAAAAAAPPLEEGGTQVAPTRIDWVPFDRAEAERLAEDEGRLVFVDVTADWCFTCKVNERRVLETRRTEQLFEQYRVVPMKADWTNRDDTIARFLADHGRYGIPFYLLYRPGQDPQLFSELITHGALARAVEQAAAEIPARLAHR